MDKIELVNLSPYFLSLAISLSVGIFAFTRRHVVGAKSFGLIILFEVITTSAYILELLAAGLQAKMFWDNLQWYTSLIYPVALLLFSFEYCALLKTASYRIVFVMLVVSLFLASVISFDIFPGLAIVSPELIEFHPFSIYTYQFGLITILAAIFAYITTIMGITLMVIDLLRKEKHFRIQTFIIILGVLIPVLGSTFVLVGIELFPNRDIAPLTFAIANLIIVYGLFRYGIFDIIPLARSSVMDFMNDPVVILDQNDLILDGNLSFEKLVGVNKKSFIHQSVHEYISSTLFKKGDIQIPANSQEEGLVHYAENIGYFDVSTKTFQNRLSNYSGRLIILHDLTSRKINENQLQLNNDVLEETATLRNLELEQLNSLLITEVNERKRAEKEKDNYAQEMEVLFNLAIEISELEVGEDIEEFLARRLKEINQAFFVVLSEYDSEKKKLYPKHIIIDEQAMAKVIEIIGEDPRKINLPVDDLTYQHITNEVVLYRQSLNQAFYGVIDPKVGVRIQETFSIDQFVGVSIKSNGKLAASLVIALQKNRTVPSPKFYESLANLASVVFWRKQI